MTVHATFKKVKRKEKSTRLRRKMIQGGFAFECTLCAMKPRWNGQDLMLEIDHINGDPLDNRKQNLRFLCPNCHSQTETYARQKQALRGTVVGELFSFTFC